MLHGWSRPDRQGHPAVRPNSAASAWEFTAPGLVVGAPAPAATAAARNALNGAPPRARPANDRSRCRSGYHSKPTNWFRVWLKAGLPVTSAAVAVTARTVATPFARWLILDLFAATRP